MFRRQKAAKEDYTAAKLPSTRRAVFFDVLKLQFFKLALCGLVTLAAAMPFLGIAMLQDGYQLSLYQQNVEGMLENTAAAMYHVTFQNLMGMLEIPFFLILAVALSGVSRVVKLLAWEEPVTLWPDMGKGVRQNWKQYLLLGFLTGLVSFLCRYALGQGVWLPSVLCLVLLGPVGAYLSVCICVYSLPMREQIKYALLLYSKAPLKTLLAAAACLLVFLPQYLPNPYIHLVGRLVSGFCIPIVMLGWFCFAFGQMDRAINASRYPDLVDRGLYKDDE